MRNFIEKSSMKTALFVFFSLSITGCAEYDRIPATKFEPEADCAPGYRCFMYQAPADMFSAEKSESGERYRLKMLEAWLKDNGLQGKPYEVISRVPIRAGNGGSVFYKIRVKE